MKRTFGIWGAAFAFLAVALGAFGAHGLRERISAEALAIYQTGVHYQLVHALALLLLAALAIEGKEALAIEGKEALAIEGKEALAIEGKEVSAIEGKAASAIEGKGALAAGWLFIAGVVVFSGSLYLLATTGAKWWGAVTPIGGLCFLVGWVCLIVAFAKR